MSDPCQRNTHTWLKTTPGIGGLARDKSEVLAANSNLNTNVPGEGKAPELSANSEMTD